MRKYFIMLLVFVPLLVPAQDQDQDKTKSKKKTSQSGIGIKGGLNFAKVTKASAVNAGSYTGFHVGVFKSTGKKFIGYRMQLDFARQGYNFKTNTDTGKVDLDYILFTNCTALNIGKFAQLYAGLQTTFLINAKADSTSDQSGGMSNSIMKYYNRIGNGLIAGLQIHPYKGIVIGASYTFSFANSFQNPGSGTPNTPTPSFIPSFDAKNNVLQIYLGYKF